MIMFLFVRSTDLNGFLFENKNENMKVLRYGTTIIRKEYVNELNEKHFLYINRFGVIHTGKKPKEKVNFQIKQIVDMISFHSLHFLCCLTASYVNMYMDY